MTDLVHVKAPAKVNLHLNVKGVRPDGFHALESIFQTIPLYDELTIQVFRNQNFCDVQCKQMDLPTENTITKAYNEFCKISDLNFGVNVELTKKIPSGAGLGGGSSDAASFLLALNKLFAYPLSKEQLNDVAALVGSDVPFFLEGGCAVVTGRGEFVKRISERKDLSFILIYPDFHSSTKHAYDLLDEYDGQEKLENVLLLEDLEKEYNKNAREWRFFNSFFQPLSSEFPVISQVVHELKQNGADFANLTGSGSVVFGVFADENVAKNVLGDFCKKWNWSCCLLSSDFLQD